MFMRWPSHFLGVIAWFLAQQSVQAGFVVMNLVSDKTSVNTALLEDPNLVNAWGASYAPGGPFWVSANGTGLAIVYSVDPATNVPSKFPSPPLEVTIPGFPPPNRGTPTGQVFNPSSTAFNGDSFLF